MNQRPPSPSSPPSSSSSSAPSTLSSSSPSSSIKNEEQDTGKFTTWESPAHDVKINYPSSWRIEKAKTPSTLVIFKPPRDKSHSDTLFESVGISLYNVPQNRRLEQATQEIIHDLENKYHDFTLIEIVPTTLAGLQAHRMVYNAHGKRFMGVVTIEKNKVYQVMYVAEPSKYDSYLTIVQKMLDSFEIKQ